MKTTTDQFHHMKGHVTDGCVIVAPSGREFTLRMASRGWVVLNPDGSECSGNLPGWLDVEIFVINGLQNS